MVKWLDKIYMKLNRFKMKNNFVYFNSFLQLSTKYIKLSEPVINVTVEQQQTVSI